MTDPVVEAAEVRGQIGDLLERAVRLLRVVLVGSALTVVLLVLVLGGLLRITADTNEVVRNEVVVLQDRNTELEDANADHEQVVELATDWIVYLAGQMQAAGLEVPAIELRPGAEGPPP